MPPPSGPEGCGGWPVSAISGYFRKYVNTKLRIVYAKLGVCVCGIRNQDAKLGIVPAEIGIESADPPIIISIVIVPMIFGGRCLGATQFFYIAKTPRLNDLACAGQRESTRLLGPVPPPQLEAWFMTPTHLR